MKILFSFLLTISFLTTFSQKDSTSYQRFFEQVFLSYKNFSKPPIKNFFEILSNTAGYNFTTSNPYFRKALKEITDRVDAKEEDAVKKLYIRVLKDIKPFLWVSAENIYDENKTVFALYNSKICPCIKGKVKRNDRMEVMAKAINECVAVIMKDTTYSDIVQKIAGDKTQSEKNMLQQYAFLYSYQNCEILNHKFTDVIFDESVVITYYNNLETIQMEKGVLAMEYYRDKKFDSLAQLFPLYKKFLQEFNKALKVLSEKDVKMRTSYFGSMDTEQEIQVTFLTEKKKDVEIVGRVIIKTPVDAFDSKITSLKFNIPPKY